ncbi:20S proteasome subunit alpha 3 [Nematocida sp. AWRm77]|nr:20S proteasome subunit alpha 3 [Nematocida sp. AWRm77]
MEDADKLTNTFSEEGRIHQVEYAIKGVSSAGPAIGIRFTNGVVLIGKSTDDSASLAQDEKIYRLNDQTVGIVGGLYADSNLLVNYARAKAQEYLCTYDQEMSTQLIAKSICKIKQRFTQGGGMRPFGVSFMIAGSDEHHNYSLYGTDPSGTLTEWNVHCFGEGDKHIHAVFEDLTHTPEKEEAIVLAFRGLASTSEGTLATPHSISCTVLYSEEGTKHIKNLSQKEVEEYLSKVQRLSSA